MKRIVFLSLAFLAVLACQAQQKKEGTRAGKTTSVKTPHGHWTVHKQFDANGNLIRKDSTYTYRYATINGKPVPQAKMDSLLSRFRSDIRFNFKQMGIPQNFDLDSLGHSFFDQNFVNLQQMHQHMLQQMRALQEQFMKGFKSMRPNLIPREEKNPAKASPHQAPHYSTQRI